MKDTIITCTQCQTLFVVTFWEQKRIMAKGFVLPKRCPDCRKNKLKAAMMNKKWRDKGRVKHGWKRNDYHFDR